MDLKIHIKILYWFCLLSGLLHFTYDNRGRRLVRSSPLHILSYVLYTIIAVSSGYLAVMLSLRGILRVVNNRHDFLQPSFLAQDDVIEYLEYTFKYIAMFVNVLTFLRYKRRIRCAIREMLAIFDLITQKTGDKIFLHPSIRYLFFIKLLFGTYHVVHFTARGISYFLKIYDFSTLLAGYLWQASSWSLMYAHLIMICFYVKLDRYLSRYVNSFEKVENDKRLQEVIQISFQIHRAKKGLEMIYSPFLVLTYYGLLNDITNLFGIMKELLYKTYIVGHPDTPMQRVCSILQTFPDGISATFEIYMIGCISNTLKKAEEFLQDRIITFGGSDHALTTRRTVQRDIEVQLVHNKVHELSIWAYRMFRVDKGFAFDFFVNIVVMYVIICLQYFARESVYSTSEEHTRLLVNYTNFNKKFNFNF